MTPTARRAAAVLVPALALGACVEGSALAPASPEAGRIAGLWWFLLAAGTLVYLLVLTLLAVPLWRSRRRRRTAGGAAKGGTADATPTGAEADADAPTRRRLVLLGGIALPAVVVVTVVVAGSLVAPAVAPTPGSAAADDEVVIDIVGAQFWWRVTYPDHAVVTANEIHVPTGRPVRVRLRSVDVIHSFWVPPLHGKIDLRPGAETELTFEVDRAGEYRGRCAEYCGLAHAQMALLVVAQEPDAFTDWIEHAAREARDPTAADARQGRQLFADTCAACHQVRGHTPPAELGPDLTHLASRATLAAGTIPNQRDELATWIRTPHAVKPGVAMPPSDLDDDALAALLAYLEGLE
jgi:cytochrome c oxidase subunit 2